MKTDIEKILEAVGHPKSEIVKLSANSIRIRTKSDVWFDFGSIPNDLNAIRELELLVIEKFGANEYGACLASEVGGFSILGKPMATTARIATADAATRITAMLAVIEEAGK